MQSPTMMAPPFQPEGVTFSPVSSKLITARILTGGLWLLLPFLACVVLGIVLSPFWFIGAAVCFAIFLWECWLAPRQVHALGYAERDEDILIRSGILFRSMVVVPYGRMQFVDVKVGPLDRLFGIGTVQLHTAAASTDATIPGLPPAEAELLRDRLADRGQARLAGL